MVQHGEWGENLEVYAAAWLYGVNITIYSQEYTNTNGMLVINADGHQRDIVMVHAMWTTHIMGIITTTASVCPTTLISQ